MSMVGKVMEVRSFITETVNVPGHDFDVVVFGAMFASACFWVSSAWQVSFVTEGIGGGARCKM